MAADTAVWSDEMVYAHVKKITRLTDGSLVGVSGVPANLKALVDFLEYGGSIHDFKPLDDEHFGALILAPDHTASWMDRGGAVSGVHGEFFAEGAAAEMAMGAMLGGASAEEAVRICIANHAWAAGHVVSLSLYMPEEPEVTNDDRLEALDL